MLTFPATSTMFSPEDRALLLDLDAPLLRRPGENPMPLPEMPRPRPDSGPSANGSTGRAGSS